MPQNDIPLWLKYVILEARFASFLKRSEKIFTHDIKPPVSTAGADWVVKSYLTTGFSDRRKTSDRGDLIPCMASRATASSRKRAGNGRMSNNTCRTTFIHVAKNRRKTLEILIKQRYSVLDIILDLIYNNSRLYGLPARAMKNNFMSWLSSIPSPSDRRLCIPPGLIAVLPWFCRVHVGINSVCIGSKRSLYGLIAVSSV